MILEQFRMSRRGINWEGLGIIFLGVLAAITIFHLDSHPEERKFPCLAAIMSYS